MLGAGVLNRQGPYAREPGPTCLPVIYNRDVVHVWHPKEMAEEWVGSGSWDVSAFVSCGLYTLHAVVVASNTLIDCESIKLNAAFGK